jgi:hypothetical protein
MSAQPIPPVVEGIEIVDARIDYTRTPPPPVSDEEMAQRFVEHDDLLRQAMAGEPGALERFMHAVLDS